MLRYRGRRVGPIMHIVHLLLGLIVSSRFCQCLRDTQISGEDSPDGLRTRHGLPIESDAALPVEAEATGYVNDARDYGENETSVSLCILLIVRDEEANLRVNLPLWGNVASCYVIGVDDRTTDGTVQAIREVLPEEKPRFVFFFTFKDFAQARNAVLRSASHNFPDVSHILIADADWKPQQETLDLSDLDFDHGTFQFRIWDHSGHTTRLVEWLLWNVPGLKFKYRIHETLDRSVMSNKYSKMIKWEVAVIESDSSWHATEHKHSRTAERFLFDINLLKMDYTDDPTDLHTLFYLGITTYSYMETLIGKGTHERTPELQKLIEDGTHYLHQAVNIYGDQDGLEFVWSSIRWIAYGYHYFVGDSEEAEKWYRKCINYDVTRVDCEAFLSRLYLDIGDLDSAWDHAKVGLLYRNPMHRPMDFFYVFECFVPMQAAKVISERIVAESLGEDSLDGVLTLGWYLLMHHRDHCNHGVLVDTQDDVDNLESWFKDTIEREGVDVAEIKGLALLSPEPSLLSVLLDKWGTGSSVLLYTAHSVGERQHGTNTKMAETSKPPSTGLELDDGGDEDDESERTSSGVDTLTDQECSGLVQQARILSEPTLGGSGDWDSPVLTTTNFTQIKAFITGDSSSNWKRDLTQPFRALVLGGEEGGGGGGQGGSRVEVLENEELLRLMSLLLQLASLPILFEVTYASADEGVLEAARVATARCLVGFNISDASLRFLHSNLRDFLHAGTDGAFDFVDLGGPLSIGREDRHEAGHGTIGEVMGTDVVDGETLKHLGVKLAPGALLRAWAFADNPSTKLVFRIAKNHIATAAESTGSSTERGSNEYLLRNVVRKIFGVRQERGVPRCCGGAHDASSDTDATEDTFVSPIRSSLGPRHTKNVAEETWVGKIIAGGDRLGITDIDKMLSDSGFELILTFGRCGQAEQGGDLHGVLKHVEDVIVKDLSRWEMADLADSFRPSPVLVHQVLAVWHGNASIGSVVS